MKFKKKNILIVGGTGFIGYHLAKRCLKKFNVFSLSLSKPKKKRSLRKVKYLFGNLRNIKSLNQLNNIKFDYVVNGGGYVDHVNKIRTYENHFKSSVNLYNYFKERELIAFVQLGSSAEYGKRESPLNENVSTKPKDIYGKAKLLASNFLLEKFHKYGFPVIILRFFQIYGPNQDFNRFIPFVINECLNNKNFDCSPCTQKRDFLFIDDAVDAILLSLRVKKAIGQIINIGDGKPIILKTVIKKIIKIIKKGKPQFGKIKLRSDESKIIYPDLKKVKKILNWQSKSDFNKNLNKTIKYYKKVK